MKWIYFDEEILKKANNRFYKIKTNPEMCIMVSFKIRSDQPGITWNALKSQISNVFTKS